MIVRGQRCSRWGSHTCKGPEVPKSLHVQRTKNSSLQWEHNKAWGHEKMQKGRRQVTGKAGSSWAGKSPKCQVRILDCDLGDPMAFKKGSDLGRL